MWQPFNSWVLALDYPDSTPPHTPRTKDWKILAFSKIFSLLAGHSISIFMHNHILQISCHPGNLPSIPLYQYHLRVWLSPYFNWGHSLQLKNFNTYCIIFQPNVFQFFSPQTFTFASANGGQIWTLSFPSNVLPMKS